MGSHTVSPPRADDKVLLLQAVQAILAAIEKQNALLEDQNELLGDFAGAFLNSTFPHGKPLDRWRRR